MTDICLDFIALYLGPPSAPAKQLSMPNRGQREVEAVTSRRTLEDAEKPARADSRCSLASSIGSGSDAGPMLPTYSESEVLPPAYELEISEVADRQIAVTTRRPSGLQRRRCSVYAVAGRWGISNEDARELMQNFQDAQSGPISPIAPGEGTVPW